MSKPKQGLIKLTTDIFYNQITLQIVCHEEQNNKILSRPTFIASTNTDHMKALRRAENPLNTCLFLAVLFSAEREWENVNFTFTLEAFLLGRSMGN